MAGTLATASLCLLACSGPALVDDAQPSQPEPQPAETKQPVTIAIAGDVHFSERTAMLLDDPESAFGPIAEVFQGADHAVVNLETAVTTRGEPEPKQWHFRAPPATFDAIAAAGIDLVSLANNHVLDYGRVGLSDTLAAAATANIAVVGAGLDDDAALAPVIVDLDGTTVAYVAASGVWELTDEWIAAPNRSGVAHLAHGERLEQAVRAASTAADVVIVLPHWGTEGQQCPSDEQREWAERFAAAGADAIVGTHAHLLQGMGRIDNTYVAYGLGNFVWWRNDAFSDDTGVITFTIDGGSIVSMSFVPAVIDDTGRPIPVDDAEESRLRSELHKATDCSGLTD